MNGSDKVGCCFVLGMVQYRYCGWIIEVENGGYGQQTLSIFRQLKDKGDEAQRNQRWTQRYASSWENWQRSWWHSSYENHLEDVPSTD